MKAFVGVLLAALTGPECMHADDPLLEIDTGGHTAPIHAVVFTSDSKYLFSAGDDKVVRKWDLATGKTIQAIRGQISAGLPGKLYAVALSKRYLAVAGYLTDNLIRIHDAATGEVVTNLKGHKNTVECLAFSPDGVYLASGDAGGLVRLWEVAKAKAVREFIGHKDRVHSVAFSIDGERLVSASKDGTLRLWNVSNGKLIRELVGHTGFVVSAAFSPDGRLLASVGEDRTLRFWNPKTGEAGRVVERAVERPANIVFTPDSQGILLTWLADGHSAAGIFLIRAGEVVMRFPSLTGMITATAFSPDGRMAATAGGENQGIDLWDPSTGKPIRRLAGQGKPVWSVAFSKDGRAVFFGNSRYAQTVPNNQGPLENVIWLNREQAGHRLEVDWGAGAAATIKEGSPVKIAEDQLNDETLRVGPGPNGDPAAALQLIRGGQVVRQFVRDARNGYRHLCYTFTKDGRIISGGVAGALSIYTDSGAKPLDLVGHTGEVWSLAVSPDNRTLVSGSDDQTVRLWDIATGRNLLSLFAGGDREWVAWTPEGYFASSLNGEKSVGWHLNQGEGQNAKFWTVARYRSQFDRPDIVSQYLKDHDIGHAVQQANHESGKPQTPPISPAEVAAIAPPEVHLFAPDADNTVVDRQTYTVKAFVFSTTNLPVTQISVLVNGRLASDIIKPSDQNKKEVSLEVKLDSGVNTITVRAANQKGISGEDTRRIQCNLKQPRSNLILLAIGVSKYKQSAISQLQFADNDAQQIEQLFLTQVNGRLFEQVKSRVLSNDKADHDQILDALGWFSTEGTPADVRVLFISGHGARLGPRNEYYFCPYNHDLGERQMAERYDIRWSTLMDSLTAMGGKAVLMVDTCHAAAVNGTTGTKGLEPANFDSVLAEYKALSGVAVFAASRGSEKSIEKPEWRHGAFTKAVIDALSGKVTGDQEGIIRTSELGTWVSNEVPRITGESQHPVVYYLPPDELTPFPIFSLKHR
jgi:WD40 repeat protein